MVDRPLERSLAALLVLRAARALTLHPAVCLAVTGPGTGSVCGVLRSRLDRDGSSHGGPRLRDIRVGDGQYCLWLDFCLSSGGGGFRRVRSGGNPHLDGRLCAGVSIRGRALSPGVGPRNTSSILASRADRDVVTPPL